MLAKCVTLVVKMASDTTGRMVFIVRTLFKCEGVVQVQRNYEREFNVLEAPSRICVMSLVQKFEESVFVFDVLKGERLFIRLQY